MSMRFDIGYSYHRVGEFFRKFNEIVDLYGYITLADVYDLINQTNYACVANTIGWTKTIDKLSVKILPGVVKKHAVEFPDPIKLDIAENKSAKTDKLEPKPEELTSEPDNTIYINIDSKSVKNFNETVAVAIHVIEKTPDRPVYITIT